MGNSFAVKKKPDGESVIDSFLGMIGCGPKKKRGE